MNEKINTIEQAMNYIDYIEGETWKVIPNYSQYLISNYGRIFGFKHKAIKTIGKKRSFKKKRKKNRNKDKQRYFATRLYDDSGKLSNALYIHRLVAEVFCFNPDPESKTEVHHININTLDNRADNLIWLTPKEHREIHKKLREQKESENNES